MEILNVCLLSTFSSKHVKRRNLKNILQMRDDKVMEKFRDIFYVPTW